MGITLVFKQHWLFTEHPKSKSNNPILESKWKSLLALPCELCCEWDGLHCRELWCVFESFIQERKAENRFSQLVCWISFCLYLLLPQQEEVLLIDHVLQYFTKYKSAVTSRLCWGWIRSQGTRRAAMHGESSVEEFSANLTHIITNLSVFANMN